jgi:hypothetical protein
MARRPSVAPIRKPSAADRPGENVGNSVSRLYYNASTMICVPTSLAQEVGEALGAQAGQAKLTEVLSEAASPACGAPRRALSTWCSKLGRKRGANMRALLFTPARIRSGGSDRSRRAEPRLREARGNNDALGATMCGSVTDVAGPDLLGRRCAVVANRSDRRVSAAYLRETAGRGAAAVRTGRADIERMAGQAHTLDYSRPSRRWAQMIPASN